MALLSVYRALLSVYRAVLSACRALLSVYRALLNVYRGCNALQHTATQTYDAGLHSMRHLYMV